MEYIELMNKGKMAQINPVKYMITNEVEYLFEYDLIDGLYSDEELQNMFEDTCFLIYEAYNKSEKIALSTLAEAVWELRKSTYNLRTISISSIIDKAYEIEGKS